MPNAVVSWRTEALRMLQDRDRYSRDAVICEFSEKLKTGDPFENTKGMHTAWVHDFFVTKFVGGPKLNILIAFIVWEFDAEKNHATVLAVTKKQPWNRKDIALLSHQSHRGYLAPKWPWQGCKECANQNLQNV